jgi:hypothetical protein
MAWSLADGVTMTREAMIAPQISNSIGKISTATNIMTKHSDIPPKGYLWIDLCKPGVEIVFVFDQLSESPSNITPELD